MVRIASTLGNALRSYAQFHPDQEALVSPGFRINYREYESLTNQFAHYLSEQGVKKGDRVPFLIGINASFALTVMALAKIGAIAVPMNYRWNQEWIHWAIDDLEADYILVEDQFYPLVQDYVESGKIRSTLVCEHHKVSPDLLAKLQKYLDTPPDIEVKPEDPCTIVFTSGTTGRPKGVVSSHNAFFASGISCTSFVIDMYSRHLVATPSFHISGIAPVCFQAYLGLSLVFPPKLTPEPLLETIDIEKVNTVFLHPHLLGILLPIIYKSDSTFPSLKRVMSGATRVPESIINDYEKLGFEVVQAYGSTETTGVVSIWNPKMGRDKVHTVGKVHLFPEIKILNPETKEELPPGEIGEIVIRGPQLFTEYWKKPEETKKAFYQGWFLTGDAGRIDEEGFIEVVDRYKDVIYFSEFEGIFPGEVERTIREIKDVEDVSVTGVHHPKWSEIPCAFVKLAKGSSLSKKDILQYVHQKLERHKLMEVIFCDTPLPHNANGKVDKSQLRKMYQELTSTPDE